MKISFALLALATTAVLAAPTPNTYNKRALVQANFAEVQQAAKNYSNYASQIRRIMSEIQRTTNQIAGGLTGSAGSSLKAAENKAAKGLNTAAQALANMAGTLNKVASNYQGSEGKARQPFN
ncbi:hypothetical protein FBU59_001288 [Linderina macrospora]|uniref:Uncharacterized protein n=1 Tax=Linderina macrospora TaxID=4868 RepID=A0ACC1JER7_9FUNG|nr:hypothetical protein FBU59_001288 [Linderina macrospora]